MDKLTAKMALHRNSLYKTIDTYENLTDEEVILCSQELDKIIAEIYREQISEKDSIDL
ncbi:TPA: Spo0E family sporulation regulatory protein-aspartic acid phosphatase [Clostridium botulinum]|uniref:aspartyl-phosphate phosphatase Spo0E family protein n=1 Tax=Clostridium botulinum TaxID=1491 RepID=UPI001C9AD313|nr:aspartyl-phosphate phosphatase Spo0E family protein [Clostridium botulinum]MBY6909545.1 aspartyl-phosphate phosphatase Spo0E family protein [Clostridium botulinum]